MNNLSRSVKNLNHYEDQLEKIANDNFIKRKEPNDQKRQEIKRKLTKKFEDGKMKGVELREYQQRKLTL